jgi:hypothetical protein
MGYTAWDAGLAVAPRGLGTLVAMLLIGQLSRRGSIPAHWSVWDS